MVTIKRFVFCFLCTLIVFGLLFGARYASLSFLTRDANPYFADLKKIDSAEIENNFISENAYMYRSRKFVFLLRSSEFEDVSDDFSEEDKVRIHIDANTYSIMLLEDHDAVCDLYITIREENNHEVMYVLRENNSYDDECVYKTENEDLISFMHKYDKYVGGRGQLCL